MTSWCREFLRNCVDSCHIYIACLSPALNGNSEIRRFERSDAIGIRNRIISDFYTGLPHNVMYKHSQDCTVYTIRIALYTQSGLTNKQSADELIVYSSSGLTFEMVYINYVM